MSAVSEDGRRGSPGGAGAVTRLDPRRWKALAVLAAVQFMLTLDVTVVTVALPKIQANLHFSSQGLPWVINGYVLMAGGLLLLGGRLADMFGRRRIFMMGVLVFGLASVTCGAATSSSMLVVSRFVQGTGEALAGPASLGMIPVLFPDSKERMKALGVWGGIAGLGGTFGAVISGALTSIDWRWIFYVNIPVAVFALIMVTRIISESRMTRTGHSIDWGGAVTVTGGLVAMVYGLLQGANHPFGSAQVLVPFLGGIALLVVMAVIESRVPDPMIPIRFFTNRTRLTSNFVSLALFAAFIAYVFMLMLYLQQILGYSPLKSGVITLPLGVAMGLGMGVATGIMPRIGVRAVLVLGFIGSAVGLFLAGNINPHSSYVGGILPGLIVFGLFSGICYPGLINGALHQVTGQDSGLGSGAQTAMQQIGGAVGVAVLVPIALRYATDHIHRGVAPAAAQTAGYSVAFRVGAAICLASAVLVMFLLEQVTSKPRTALAEVPSDNEEVLTPAAARQETKR
jgi:EmrB/QacA subfamily drug resistance transporter